MNSKKLALIEFSFNIHAHQNKSTNLLPMTVTPEETSY